MAYKAFEENQINGQPFVEEQTISISEDSPCASHLHLFTGIRSLGKLDAFKVDTLPSFDEIDKKEIKYQWNFDSTVLAGQSLTSDITTGVFLSTADQTYNSSTNTNSLQSSQNIFRYAVNFTKDNYRYILILSSTVILSYPIILIISAILIYFVCQLLL